MDEKEMEILARMIAGFVEENLDEVLTAEKAAELLGWNIRSVYNRKDDLGGWKYGRRLYFSKQFIMQLIKGPKEEEGEDESVTNK